MKKKQFVVIGMGRFGSSIAQTLYELGFEVLAVDENEDKVQDVINVTTHAVQADCTDEEALKALGIRNFDVVVVAIGQDIQASILTTLMMKEMGAKQLIVKAQSELHGKVLTKIGADKVIFPERDMGVRVAHHLISPNIIDFIELSDDYSIVEITASTEMVGHTIKELDIRARFGCNVIAIRSNGKMNISPYADDVINEGDILIVVGNNEDLNKFEVSFS
ncbi:potassium channel family protein [Marinicrinis lubricantis]|uniref:Potassium channel family protein n=1 Tax=Marinicrinis lubricantis TaxID=2086470 RepID=A0ABW1IJA6_9BACL